MYTKKLELERRQFIDVLFLETKKLLQYIDSRQTRKQEKIDNEILAFKSFYLRLHKLSNCEELIREVGNKILDFIALKNYNIESGQLQYDSSEYIQIAEKLYFRDTSYVPQPQKYIKWLYKVSNKFLTKNDILTLLLFIIKEIGLNTDEYQAIILKEFGTKIAIKKPRYKIILTREAILLPPLEILVESQKGYFHYKGIHIKDNGFEYLQFLEQNSNQLFKHHQKIFNLASELK